ncbi:MAG: CoA transferase [Phreatobacter sp.]|uniref:CaiB/BaiF CoA transferase family protein n=1 Tax=Phreatobacter sp. TaxID=1966341 RepID=UPI001A5CC92E|nr:CaiB/BaiF CoA-transferase family protein [Phreatobacter sp.]MBL8570252.1 CoA transferase [Phreatobacter sp.]
MPAPLPPLRGLKVLDFSNLLPGPLASLLLVEAGAEVIKVERPGTGDEMRGYFPPLGASSGNFALLNRGKTSLVADLKDAGDLAHVMALAAEADVLIEQFRPGVMARVGLAYEDFANLNPRLVYCSISGYGQSGPRVARAGHDLNYLAEAGLLGLTRGVDGAPVLPQVLAADIGGGAYPAVINILMALQGRERSGKGCHLDIAMADNLFAFAYWGLAAGYAGAWPKPGRELITGGSPRYQIYRTADGRFLAAAPLEERFWQVFCEKIGLAEDERDDSLAAEVVKAKVSRLIAGRAAAEWQAIFGTADACVSVVATLKEAASDPAFVGRGLFARAVTAGDATMPALPVPLDRDLRDPAATRDAPALDEAGRRVGWPGK